MCVGKKTIEVLAKTAQREWYQTESHYQCIGILHTSEFGPEKTWRHLNAQTMHDVFAINAFAVGLAGETS